MNLAALKWRAMAVGRKFPLHKGHVKMALVAGFAFVPFVVLIYVNPILVEKYRELKHRGEQGFFGITAAAASAARNAQAAADAREAAGKSDATSARASAQLPVDQSSPFEHKYAGRSSVPLR